MPCVKVARPTGRKTVTGCVKDPEPLSTDRATRSDKWTARDHAQSGVKGSKKRRK